MDKGRDVFPENSFIDELRSALGVPFVEGEEISDHYLNRAIGACCTEVYGHGRLSPVRLSTKVRDLIASNAPADKPWMNYIPQERRRQFLTELASITARPLPPTEPIWAEPNPLPHEPTQPQPDHHTTPPTNAQPP